MRYPHFRRLILSLVLAVLPLSSLSAFAALSEPTPQVAPHQTTTGCSVDLMLALDGSGSISPTDFQLMKDFVRQLGNSFTIGPRDANLGIVQFSNTAELYLGLSQEQDEVLRAIDNMTQFGERTDIASAIALAQQQFITRREGIPRVIIVLTDGNHNMLGNPIAQADIARAQGTAILGIAVGQVDLNELISISGGEQNVIAVGGFQGLSIILDILLNNTCAFIALPGADLPATPIVVTATPSGATPSGPTPTPIPTSDVQVAYVPPSADRTQIVFASDRDGDMEIFVMDGDGSNVRQLTFNNATDDKPAWSKDGTRIAFESDMSGDYEIYVINADGNNLTQLTDNTVGDWGPAWSPDNSKLAFHSEIGGDLEIYVVNADGTGLKQITDNTATDRSPSWSPDGTEIIYYSDESGGRELYVVNINTLAKRRLTTNEFYDGQPDWSLNGTGVVFGSSRLNNNSEIYIMRIDGSNIIRLTDRTGVDDDPIWSPDGRQIAFESDANGNYDIWVVNADGTGLQALTTGTSRDWSPDWMWRR